MSIDKLGGERFLPTAVQYEHAFHGSRNLHASMFKKTGKLLDELLSQFGTMLSDII